MPEGAPTSFDTETWRLRRFNHSRRQHADRAELGLEQWAEGFGLVPSAALRACVEQLSELGLPWGLLRSGDRLESILPPWSLNPLRWWSVSGERLLGETFDLLEANLEMRMIEAGFRPSQDVDWGAIVTFDDYVSAWVEPGAFLSRHDP